MAQMERSLLGCVALMLFILWIASQSTASKIELTEASSKTSHAKDTTTRASSFQKSITHTHFAKQPLRPLTDQSYKKTSPDSEEASTVRPSSMYVRLSSGNVIDDCWRSNPKWQQDRMQLADCAKGYGSNALGGKKGRYYVVTENGDDPINPWPGTLRYGVTLPGPAWVTFAFDMAINLKEELLVSSFKTIDGRGANVHISHGPCIAIAHVSHVIIHGLHIHNCIPGRSGEVKSDGWHIIHQGGSDGDGITVFGSNHIWIDRNTLETCYDGLIDIVHASTDITISNNFFSNHNKVMLLGHDDAFSADQILRVTLMYNHFGQGLVQRIPRIRLGYAHIINNLYTSWQMYAVGGSANPTIRSECNYYVASNSSFSKQITKREYAIGMEWDWKSFGDIFINGAYFIQSGHGAADPYYNAQQWFTPQPAALVPALTANAGPLH